MEYCGMLFSKLKINTKRLNCLRRHGFVAKVLDLGIAH